MLHKRSRSSQIADNNRTSCKNTRFSKLNVIFEQNNDDAKIRVKRQTFEKTTNLHSTELKDILSYVYQPFEEVDAEDFSTERDNALNYVFDPNDFDQLLTPKRIKYISKTKNIKISQRVPNVQNNKKVYKKLKDPKQYNTNKNGFETTYEPIHEYKRDLTESSKTTNAKSSIKKHNNNNKDGTITINQEVTIYESGIDETVNNLKIVQDQPKEKKNKKIQAGPDKKLMKSKQTVGRKKLEKPGIARTKMTAAKRLKIPTNLFYDAMPEDGSKRRNALREGTTPHDVLFNRTPSELANYIHLRFPRFNYKLQRMNNTKIVFDVNSSEYYFSLIYYSLLCFGAIGIFFVLWLVFYKRIKSRPSRLSFKFAQFVLCIALTIPAAAPPLYANDMTYRNFLQQHTEVKGKIVDYLDGLMTKHHSQFYKKFEEILRSLVDVYFVQFYEEVVGPRKQDYKWVLKCDRLSHIPTEFNATFFCQEAEKYNKYYSDYEKSFLRYINLFPNFTEVFTKKFINNTERDLQRYYGVHNIIYHCTSLFWTMHLLFLISLIVFRLLQVHLFYFRAPTILALLSIWTIAAIHLPLTIGIADLCQTPEQNFIRFYPFLESNIRQFWITDYCLVDTKYKHLMFAQNKKYSKQLLNDSKQVFVDSFAWKQDEFEEALDNLTLQLKWAFSKTNCNEPRKFIDYFADFVCGRFLQGLAIISMCCVIVGTMYGFLVIIVYRYQRILNYHGEEVVYLGKPWDESPRPGWSKILPGKIRKNRFWKRNYL